MKGWKRILIYGLALLAVLPATGFEFASDGRAKCVIAVGETPSALEEMAAADLQNFLEKMTGGTFQVVSEDKAGPTPAVYLGQTRFAERNGIDPKKFGKEEWEIKSVGPTLVVTGGRPVGTFYGVWALLQKLGCYSLTFDQDVVPSRPTLAQSGLDERKKPAFKGRLILTGIPGFAMRSQISPEQEKAYNLWQLRSGMNGVQTQRTKPYYISDFFNISQDPQWHTLSQFVNPDVYFKTHPEYFSMDEKGKRFRPKTSWAKGSLCMSNPDVERITLESLRKMIQKDRKEKSREDWPYIYDISILDDSPFICKCPTCSAISKEEGSECGLLFRYINYVANEIAKEYPDVLIRTFAYSSTQVPPKKTRPASNVLIQVCDEFPASDPFVPLTAPVNENRLKSLMRWHELGAKLTVWDYWDIAWYFKPPRVEVLVDAIAPDFRLFHRLNVQGLFIQGGIDDISPQNFMELEFFLATQLMMNPDQDAEHLIDVFLDGFYGPAALAMKKWLNQLRAGIKAHPRKETILTAGSWSYWTPQFAVESYRLLKKAAESLPEGSVYRRRVESEMITPIWVSLLKRGEFEPAFKKAGIGMDELAKECRCYVLNHIRRYRGKNVDFADKMFEDRFKSISVALPRPEKFKNVADGDIRVLGWPQAVVRKGSSVVADPDSITGKACKTSEIDPACHGVNGWVKWSNMVPATKFEIHNIGVPETMDLVLKTVLQDEKYHWYRLPGSINLQDHSNFWGFGARIVIDTSSVYVLSNGIADNNVWDCWFSAKFTGPAYAKKSKKDNAIYVDMVVLTRPGVHLSETKTTSH